MIALTSIVIAPKRKQAGLPAKTEAMLRKEYKTVFECLTKRMSLSQVNEITGVSTTTISRLRVKYFK